MPPTITSKCWAIFDGANNSYLSGKREYIRGEVASLTKIMTAYTVLKLIKQFKLDPSSSIVTVQEVAAEINGTTANLKTGD